MNNIIIDVLNKIEDNGFTAYVVGGYVRDLIMGKNSMDVDICTDALPKDIKEIFKLSEESSEYGSISFKIGDYNFDVTTFREEISYLNRKPVEIKYIKDLYTDTLRRDFTINSICIDKNGKMIDKLNGKKDIDNKIIRLIGDNTKLREDPLRILRAIRFATILDFTIDVSLCDGINMYKELIKEIPLTRVKLELDKILVSENYKKGLNYLKKFDLLEVLGIQYKHIISTQDLCGMWAQLKVSVDYPFTKEEKDNITKIKQIVNSNNLDNYTVFKYGLYISTVASKILNINSDKIVEIYNNLPITSKNELNISIPEIKDILDTDDFSLVKEIEEKIIIKIVNNELQNEHDLLVNYIRQGME